MPPNSDQDWSRFAEDLVRQLAQEGRTTVQLTPEEFMRYISYEETPASMERGREILSKAGLVASNEPDETGLPLYRLTYRLKGNAGEQAGRPPP